MERANNTGSGAGTGPVKLVVGILIFIAIVVGLYYLYNFLYGSTNYQSSVTILSGTPSMTKADATSKAVAQTALTGVSDGGQYSASFWVYVSDTKGFAAGGGQAKLAHLLDISDAAYAAAATDRKKTLLFVGLNPRNGSLIVRQSTGDSADAQINNSATTGSATAYSLSGIIDNYNSSGVTYSANDKCDILNGIEYQRWSLISVVGNGRTLDVYVDGKLARSCVYKGQFALGNSVGAGTATFGYNNNGNLKGFFSKGQFYNYALTPDQVWTNYQAGPGADFNFMNFFSSFFNTNTSFQTTGLLN